MPKQVSSGLVVSERTSKIKNHVVNHKVGLLLVVIAFVLRVWGLSSPSACYFDETYYYYDSRQYTTQGTEESFVVHPPVGKWMIATGLFAFGVPDDSPLTTLIKTEPKACIDKEGDPPNPEARNREAAEAFARRIASAVFGTISVFFAYLSGLLLFRLRSSALLATLLLALDGLALTMSRIAMLDIFLQAFVMIGFWAMLKDRERLWEDAPLYKSECLPELIPKPKRTYLWLTGLFMGLAFATKWTAVMPWGLATLWIWGSETIRMHRYTSHWYTRFGPILLKGLAAMFVVPLFVYVLSYAGWFANWEQTSWYHRNVNAECVATKCEGMDLVKAKVTSWVKEQKQIQHFHATLEADHSYRAQPWTWLLSYRPVAYYFEDCKEDNEHCVVAPGNVAEVLGMGNPLIWWVALLSYPWLLYMALVKRKWVPATIAIFIFGQIIPYFISSRAVFMFYMTPILPFMMMALAYAAERLSTNKRFYWFGIWLAIMSVIGFFIWSPVYFGWEIPRSWWQMLMWFKSWI